MQYFKFKKTSCDLKGRTKVKTLYGFGNADEARDWMDLSSFDSVCEISQDEISPKGWAELFTITKAVAFKKGYYARKQKHKA